MLWAPDIPERQRKCWTGGQEEVWIGPINGSGCVEANGKSRTKFSRVQPVGEPLDDTAEGGEDNFPTRTSGGKFVSNPQNGLAHPDQSERSSGRAINEEGR